MGRPFLEVLDSETYCYTCKNCGNYLTNQESFQSDSFQGSSGKAYLFSNVVNITCSKTEEKTMTTGTHIVRDVSCKMCELRIGWTYEMAYNEDQRFKEGQYILELHYIRKIRSLEEPKSQSPPDSPSIELLRYDSAYGEGGSGRMGPAFVYAPPNFSHQYQWMPRGYTGAETRTRRSNQHLTQLRRAI